MQLPLPYGCLQQHLEISSPLTAPLQFQLLSALSPTHVSLPCSSCAQEPTCP
jgi:hypothetical protein